jgi:hypothetical protein
MMLKTSVIIQSRPNTVPVDRYTSWVEVKHQVIVYALMNKIMKSQTYLQEFSIFDC